jgi:hypothetical protein
MQGISLNSVGIKFNVISQEFLGPSNGAHIYNNNNFNQYHSQGGKEIIFYFNLLNQLTLSTLQQDLIPYIHASF